MAAAAVASPISEAEKLFQNGHAQTARAALERLLLAPEAASGPERLAVARALLDICDRNRDADCLARNTKTFVDAAGEAPVRNQAQAARLALESLYYIDAMQASGGVSPATILDRPSFKQQVAYDGETYLRRQVLASTLMLRTERRPELDRTLNKILSLTASLKNPQAARFTVAASLADVIGTLLEIGETERAYGLYRAAGQDVGKALPPLTLDAALFRLTEARLLQQVGRPADAAAALDEAVRVLRRIEMGEGYRQDMLTDALTLRAALAVIAADLPAAQAALAGHPYAALFAKPGRTATTAAEAGYLAARLLLAVAAETSDPAATTALQGPAQGGDASTVIYRAAGLALAAPTGPERRKLLSELARRLREYALEEDRLGRVSRLGAIDLLVVGVALQLGETPATPADTETLFILAQLASRTGALFDADALAALGQAPDELQRRSVHQALRLKAGRDRLERAGVQAAMAATLQTPAQAILQHDIAARGVLRDYAERLASAESDLGRARFSLRAARLVPIQKLQRVLEPGEAALAAIPAGDGLAYVCVRHDRARSSFARADHGRMALDARVIQAALTADHPPSDALDSQFPVDAAVRLHSALMTPFEGCLQPGDRIIWLGGTASTPAPLGVLLGAAPPKLASGYDLANADWLVRRHAITYAGSAASLVALRTSRTIAPDFDFLGVGDPKLDGRLPSGETRSAVVTRGMRNASRFEGLAPLPETADELRVSAEGFQTARLLLGEAATEAGVRGQLIGSYRYLSFATHGLLREDLQGLSDPALVLTPVSPGEDRDDGLLTASEIADMNLHASFVALSACNTANFDFDQQAQDLPALASAFAVSGVPATLGALWPVDSETAKQVVSQLFGHLRSKTDSAADALAEGQRAFIRSRPSRAYLHPRFWAAFVVLGDGGPRRPAAASGPTLKSVETLTHGSGEVLALARTPAGVAARLIAEPDATGRPGEGVRMLATGGEAWRVVGHQARASRVLGTLDQRMVAGGYQENEAGKLVPRLDVYEPDGRISASWRGEDLSTHDAGILAWAQDGEALLIVVGERRPAGDPEPGRLHVLRVKSGLRPTKLFDLALPPGARAAAATITLLGDRLLVTYSADNLASPQPPAGLDDYDAQSCLPGLRTWVQRRDDSGKVLENRTLDGVVAVSAALGKNGRVVLGGSRRVGCNGERRAALFALDSGLAPRELYLDQGLGDSEVRALTPLADGRIFVAAYKRSLLAYGATASSHALVAGSSYSILALTLDSNGRASALKLLDAGGDVVPTTALASPGGEVLLGGSLAGRAAIFTFANHP